MIISLVERRGKNNIGTLESNVNCTAAHELSV
jgi:hypothetical protein